MRTFAMCLEENHFDTIYNDYVVVKLVENGREYKHKSKKASESVFWKSLWKRA